MQFRTRPLRKNTVTSQIQMNQDLLSENMTEPFSNARMNKYTMGGQKKVAPSNYNTGIGIYDV